MNELQTFDNPEFGAVRTIFEDGRPLFVGADIAGMLGYARPSEAVSKHCRGTLKRRIGVKTGHRSDGSPAMQDIEMLFIPEGDVYRLITHSKLPAAERFEAWVFDEVLPSIRRTGGYIATRSGESDADILARAVIIAQKTIESRDKALQEQAPLVLFAQSVQASKTSILVGELAKVLKQNGVEMGQNRLFEWLRAHGYLISRRGTDYNMPTQYSMERELFEIKESTISHSDGHISINKTPKVTGKGQIYFIEKLRRPDAE